MRRALVFALVLTLPMPGRACEWDSDTLAMEARGMPDVVQIITGRFERNPPLYYEMRLARAAAQVRSHPDEFAAYDDAGVACDRLGRGDEAIDWMERKRERLDRADPADPVVREHRYRNLANVGTFWMHRWVRSGAKRARIAEVKTARDFIAEAIALNPDAHFGREKYQLRAMDWLLASPEVRKEKDYYPTSFYPRGGPSQTDPPAEAVKGIAGLIVLGNAWESVDVFNALAVALEADNRRTSVAYLAQLRRDELIDQGRGSLLPGAPAGAALKTLTSDQGKYLEHRKDVEATFRTLRAEAEALHARRTAYMQERLKAGLHPDTDPTFWAQFLDPGPPPIPDPAAGRVVASSGRWSARAWVLGGGVTLGSVGLALTAFLLAWQSHRVRRLSRGSKPATTIDDLADLPHPAGG